MRTTVQIRTPRFSFHQKLYASILATFLLFAIPLALFHLQRERIFRIELLTTELQACNSRLADQLEQTEWNDSLIQHVCDAFHYPDLRITLLDRTGNVLFDSKAEHLEFHGDRPEFIQAMHEGEGVSVRRTSSTMGKPYFYAAKRFSNYVLRASLPYNSVLRNHLKTDYTFIFFAAILVLILLIFLYRSTQKLGRTISQLRDFAQAADRSQSIESDIRFPQNELGEISQHIVGMFHNLSETRDALMIEREKLLTHLQIAKEGLAIFSPDKKEITANSLFIQYLNLISSTPVDAAESIFQLKELNEINQYIQTSFKKNQFFGQVQRQSTQIHRNGRIFQIQCIVFTDLSFEVSISDITQNEEESLIKRQLTQNIAHELKTPVSSIQGYMETIVNNPNLPKERVLGFVERSYYQSKRLSELLKDISTLSRLDEAPGFIEMEAVPIRPILDQICMELQLEIEQKNVRVQLNVAPSLIIQGNPSLLYSIFRNLMDNALAYAGENIEIVISCFRNDKDRSYFSFYDTGAGVPEEHLQRLFERFYRVDKGRSRKMGGTGLGLAIVKNAVLLHGGSISAKNRDQGGLEFIFSLQKH